MVHITVRTRLAWASVYVFACALATTQALAQASPPSAPRSSSLPSAPRSSPAPAPRPSSPSSPPPPGAASPAPATPASPTSDDARPWAKGVSEAEQDTALELFNDGNVEFAEQRFAQALAKYREAIRHWDHPAIRYNMAVCLVNLDQLVEAKENLERSLFYGPRPLDAGKYDEGLLYRKRLEGQLAYFEIVCRDPATDVTLDGKLLFKSPGAARRFLLPGTHQIVATRSGFLTLSRTLTLVAGKSASYTIRPTLELAGHEIRPALELQLATKPAAPSAPAPRTVPTAPATPPSSTTTPSAAPRTPPAVPAPPPRAAPHK